MSPLYSQPNLGGTGLALTFNIGIWGVAIWFVALSFLLNRKVLYIPKHWQWFVVFPCFILLSSLWNPTSSPIDLLFTSLFILGGFTFFIALFQFEFSQSDIEKLLFIVVITVGLHAVIGTAQIWFPDSFISQYFYSLRDGSPRGVFQQTNVNSTFLATGIIIAIYLISRPGYKTASLVRKSLLFASYFLAIYIVFSSGSRVGLLSLILAIPILLFARFEHLRQKKREVALLVLLAITSFNIGQSGIDKTVDKAAQLKEQSYSNSRVAMYTIGMELIEKRPLGYGLGSFLKVWNKQASDFTTRYPETKLPITINHPHNEFLFWMIEGGLPVLFGLICIVIGISIGLYQAGIQSGGAYAAMLLPISLHMQVELPFYISSLHWFLWLFLVYLVFRNQVNEISVKVSSALTKLLRIILVSFTLFGTLFLINTAKAQHDIYKFVSGLQTGEKPLKTALNNVYTKNYAEQLAMRSMLYHSIENKEIEKVQYFLQWALVYVEKSPELKMYEDLISASVYLNPAGKGCDMINEALTMYAHNKPLQKARDDNCS